MKDNQHTSKTFQLRAIKGRMNVSGGWGMGAEFQLDKKHKFKMLTVDPEEYKQ